VAVTVVLVAFVLFRIMKVYNRAMATREAEAPAPTSPSEIDLLTEIRDELRARRAGGETT
jgi:large conductance mechanosensitive channel